MPSNGASLGLRQDATNKVLSKSTVEPPTELRGRAPVGDLISVVIPVLNETRTLDALLARLLPVLDKSADRFEVIFVDDGSTDATLAALRDWNRRDQRVTTVSLSRNFGKEIAVAAGLCYARGNAVILMDGDLQHPPELIPEMIRAWRAGYDVVYGRRSDRTADSSFRRVFAKLFYRTFQILSRTKLPEEAGDFRLFSRRAVNALNRMGERSRFNKGLFAWIGFKTTGVPFDFPERPDGSRSRWHPRRLLRFALDGIASFSTIPLRVWSYLGLIISALAFCFILGVLIDWTFWGNDIHGFPTLLVAIMFFAGVQLISLGVIGEYLGRIYEEVKARPLYLVAEEVGISRGRARDETEPTVETEPETVRLQ